MAENQMQDENAVKPIYPYDSTFRAEDRRPARVFINQANPEMLATDLKLYAKTFTPEQINNLIKANERFADYGKRKSTTSTNEERLAFLNTRFAETCDSEGLNNVLKNLYPGYKKGSATENVVTDIDLIECLNQGFQTYKNKKGEKSVRLTTRWMYRQNKPNSSAYDKSIILKAKRIIKRMMNVYAASKMKADISLSKAFLAQRAFYNSNRYSFDPMYKVSLIKQNLAKYGSSDPVTVKAAKDKKTAEYIANLTKSSTDNSTLANTKYFTALGVDGNANSAIQQVYLDQVPVYKKYLKDMSKKPPTKAQLEFWNNAGVQKAVISNPLLGIKRTYGSLQEKQIAEFEQQQKGGSEATTQQLYPQA